MMQLKTAQSILDKSHLIHTFGKAGGIKEQCLTSIFILYEKQSSLYPNNLSGLHKLVYLLF